MNDDIVSLYSTAQRGGELPYFVGKQYGSGWLRTLGRFAIPLLKRLGGVAMKTATDAVMNSKAVLPTLKNHALDAVGQVLPTVANMFQSKSAPPVRTSKKRKRKSINKHGKTTKTIFSK